MDNGVTRIGVSLYLAFVGVSVIVDAQPVEQRRYETTRIETAPKIDGLLDDACWNAVPWAGGFTQYQPEDGTKPTQESQFKVVYDEKHIYFAFRCFDTDPDAIVSRMSRRDGFQGDWIEVNIDSYNDKRTAFSFTSSVSGVKSDEFVSEDGGNWDPSWNPIWHLKTTIDSLGWTAEVAIPFSQIRYGEGPNQAWGLQVTRHDFRKESRSSWQYIPANSGYWVSGFGTLSGLDGIEKQNQLEVQPYVLGQADFYEKIPGHPYRDGNDASLSAGLDGKIGVTSDLTLDFTINPDFGQVEADPSVLRLDGFQNFFEEKRPFFIEGRNVFNTPISNAVASGEFNSDVIFYSRRIGASPHLRLGDNPASQVYIDQPDFTSILGAAKFSGKTQSGLSIGILESMTQREFATVNSNGEIDERLVEPFTNYTVGRVRQDLNRGRTILGGVLTQVHRDINDPELKFLHENAWSGGFDILHQWNDRAWRLEASLMASRVSGSREAILRTQQAFEHGFDRPDADHLSVDTSATSLSGLGGNLAIGEHRGKWKFQAGVTFRSPGLELNDIGFLRNADEIVHYFWLGFRESNPVWIFRNLSANYNHWSYWDFGGRNLKRTMSVGAHGTFHNFWSVSFSGGYENHDISNNWLRGGPAFRKSPGSHQSLTISSDSRRVLSFGVTGSRFNSFDSPILSHGISFSIRVQPSDAINFSVSPGYTTFYREDLYVTQRRLVESTRYVLSQIDQQTFNLTARVSWNITPELTIQYYGQPYISRGNYTDFKRVTDPLGDEWTDRMLSYTSDQITFDAVTNMYSVDEDLDGQTEFSFGNPDFNFMEFRSNLVARWEYIPGSEIFLVWNQSTTQFGDPSQNVFTSFTESLFDNKLHNTLLVKITYRFVK